MGGRRTRNFQSFFALLPSQIFEETTTRSKAIGAASDTKGGFESKSESESSSSVTRKGSYYLGSFFKEDDRNRLSDQSGSRPKRQTK